MLTGNSPWNHKLTRKQTKEILLPRNTTGKRETKSKPTNQNQTKQTKIKKREKNVREKNCKQYLGGTFYLGRSLIPTTLFTFSELRKTNLAKLSLKIRIIVNVSCGSPSKHFPSLLLLWKEVFQYTQKALLFPSLNLVNLMTKKIYILVLKSNVWTLVKD